MISPERLLQLRVEKEAQAIAEIEEQIDEQLTDSCRYDGPYKVHIVTRFDRDVQSVANTYSRKGWGSVHVVLIERHFDGFQQNKYQLTFHPPEDESEDD